MAVTLLGILVGACGGGEQPGPAGDIAGEGDRASPFTATRPAWCEDLPRSVYAELSRVAVAGDWFEVYRVVEGVHAIYEPHQFQEVISYLIAGSEQAVLLDTGMGMGRISEVVRQLTDLPVVVVNTHTHPDHVGGNAGFERVLALDTEYTRRNAGGYEHAEVATQVAADALCRPLPEGMDSASYAVPRFGIDGTLDDGSILDLGGRRLEVLRIPGHTPDALALLDRENGLLFTGDSFYEGPIYLFAPETDLDAYVASVDRLAALVPELTLLLPAHNTPVAEPARLLELRDGLRRVLAGAIDGEAGDGVVEYDLGAFSLLLRPDAVSR